MIICKYAWYYIQLHVALGNDFHHLFVHSDHECSPSDEESKFEEGEEVEKISSPIRVSPERERDRSRRGRESGVSSDGKLSVKARLYVSKQTIGSLLGLI